MMAQRMPIRWQTGFDTDMGGGKENQDECFVWSNRKSSICVLIVLDGHGREVGKTAAKAAKISLREFFEEYYFDLKSSPYNCLARAHEVAHFAIKRQLRIEFEEHGYDVMEDPEGYLLKSKKGQKQWSCIHGGSTCSICALVDGHIYVANVGDSSGILCATQEVFCKADVTIVGDAAVHDERRKQYINSIHVNDSDCKDKSATIVITAEHSPESAYEFLRLRDFRPRDENRKHPSLNIVYDSAASEKAKCPPVFSLEENGLPVLNNKGSYYKNVRNEWASLVSTPGSARFPDALAFTRSLGDLHLQTFGVTHLPEVYFIDLLPIFSSLESSRRSDHDRSCSDSDISSINSDSGSVSCSGSGSGSDTCRNKCSEEDGSQRESVLCLVLATDGVWDNWAYDDLTRFVMDSSCLQAVAAGADGAHRVALSLIQRNATYSKKNFGSQADNATCIVMYLSQSKYFPADAISEEDD